MIGLNEGVGCDSPRLAPDVARCVATVVRTLVGAPAADACCGVLTLTSVLRKVFPEGVVPLAIGEPQPLLIDGPKGDVLRAGYLVPVAALTAEQVRGIAAICAADHGTTAEASVEALMKQKVFPVWLPDIAAVITRRLAQEKPRASAEGGL